MSGDDAGHLDDNAWNSLITRIRARKCTAFLGAGACYGVLPTGRALARQWAQKHGYPLDDREDLARVAQFRAWQSNNDHLIPKCELLEEFEKAGKQPDYADPQEVHGLLAELPFPVYMTTNYDRFMWNALSLVDGKSPRRELCRWNSLLQQDSEDDVFADGYDPSVEEPVVYHLHGNETAPDSLVLTEDDYLDFLVQISKNPELLPRPIRRALTGGALLFIGYSLADWNFRVLYRTIYGFLEKSLRPAHVSVQLLPTDDEMSDAEREARRAYLDGYFGGLNVSIFWGTAREFTAEFRRRWNG